MPRSRHVLVVVAGLSVVAGCGWPSGARFAPFPVAVEGGILRPGDTVPLKPGPALGSTDVTLVVTNAATGASSSRVVPNAAVASTEVHVDPADLPGFDPRGAELQTFTIQVLHAAGAAEAEISVLLDPTALPPASVPLGKAPILGHAWTIDTDDLAASVIAAWEGEPVATTSRPVDRQAIGAPAPLLDGLPEDTRFREFEVRGVFPRRIVQAPWTPPGVERAVMTPAALRFVIAETAPSRLMTLRVEERVAQGPSSAGETR
jgi:hypothetical protein